MHCAIADGPIYNETSCWSRTFHNYLRCVAGTSTTQCCLPSNWCWNHRSL